MTSREILDLLKRYTVARGGNFRRLDFVTWAAHHGLSRRTPCDLIDDAFHEAQAERVLELVEGSPHPLWRPCQQRAAA